MDVGGAQRPQLHEILVVLRTILLAYCLRCFKVRLASRRLLLALQLMRSKDACPLRACLLKVVDAGCLKLFKPGLLDLHCTSDACKELL